MSKKDRVTKVKRVIEREVASKILRTVPSEKAFYFCTDIGQYAGVSADSLADFCEKIKTLDLKSVNFHFKRRDFKKWIRETLGDIDLAKKISRIDKTIEGEKLRTRIFRTVKKRLNQLKEVKNKT